MSKHHINTKAALGVTKSSQGKIIPDICHFCYTGKIFGAKILHPKVRKLKPIGFADHDHEVGWAAPVSVKLHSECKTTHLL